MTVSPISGAPSRVQTQPRLLLSIDEGAEAFAIGRTLFETDVLPHVETIRLGRRRLIVASSLAEWLAAQPRVGAE